ncbi:sarcosine oxidase subunit gamma [Shimia aestuarii]|uniref:sarcosine oxidase subunit gamma n=1 Tax=Shimia aestuarii TaxID=254406 RepID=UPI001FB25C11|nr:sarcosine oxidase subunit gamma family protein [Shimia aestuarii]
MSNVVSALNGVSQSGIALVEETGLRGMITVRGDLASKPMAKALKDVLGASVPEQRQIASGEKGAVAWMSPDELLVICDHGAAEDIIASLNAALAGEHVLVVNVSDARAVFKVSGECAREVIAKLAPVDLAPGAFEPGMMRRTRFAQVAAAFWMNDDGSFEIICFRSVARYVFDLLCVASVDGSEVGFFN